MTEPIEPAPSSTSANAGGAPAARKYTAVDYVFQFITITAGVLIALLIGALVEWNNDRLLVAEARATINQEIAANKKDLDFTISGMQRDLEQLDAGIRFANEMLAKTPISASKVDFNLNLADLSMSGWRTAERTGALSHMNYAEVQQLSLLYDLQDLVVSQQRAMLSQLSDAISILGDDFNPERPNVEDVERFRERLMRLRSALRVHRNLAERLAEKYGQALTP